MAKILLALLMIVALYHAPVFAARKVGISYNVPVTYVSLYTNKTVCFVVLVEKKKKI